MRITRVEAWPVTMRLREPYAIAYQRVDTARNVFLRIETVSGAVGLGCAAPEPDITGETAEGTLEALSAVAAPALTGRDALRRLRLITRVERLLPGKPSALAAVDMALHDLLGRVAGLPLWRMLGGFRDRIRTSVTIGILSEEETVRRARELTAQGFRCLKLKGGVDPAEDAQRVLAVRRAVGGRVDLRFDANQGYDVEQTLAFVAATREAALQSIEQPTPRDALHRLGRVTRKAPVMIMADESLMGLRDAFRIARGSLADIINVKLMKVGGIAEAARVDAVAEAAGVETMVGCMDESALAIAAGLHFALARRNVRYADLDGHLDLEGDPAAGGVILKEGSLFPTGKPGLGVTLG